VARLAGPGITFLVALGFQLSGFENFYVALALWATAGVWALAAFLTWQPIRKRVSFRRERAQPEVPQAAANRPQPSPRTSPQSAQLRRGTENQSRRPVPPTVPAPPALPSKFSVRPGLVCALRVLATEGDELASDPDASRESQVGARGERKRWARNVSETLRNAALPGHASDFFDTPVGNLSSRNWLLSLGAEWVGGEEEIKSNSRLNKRLAKLRRIIAQLEQASGQ